jgi:hypothetical protein
MWGDRKNTRRDDPTESWKVKIEAKMALFFERSHAGGGQRSFQ